MKENPIEYVKRFINAAKANADLKKLYDIQEESFNLTGEADSDKLIIPENASLEEMRKIATEWSGRQARRFSNHQKLMRKVIDMANRWGL